MLPFLLAAVISGFDYSPQRPFTPGAHRGIDVAARPGATARAPCTGRVVWTGRAATAGVVVLRCGRWRVSLVGVRAPSVGRGAEIARGARVGLVDGYHGGLHIGVRHYRQPFGYVDPLAVLGRRSKSRVPLAPPAARPPPRRAPPRTPAREPRPPRPPVRAPGPPWFALAGAALLLVALPGVRLALAARWPTTSRRRSTT